MTSAAITPYARGTAVAHWGDFVVEVTDVMPWRVAVRSPVCVDDDDWWWVAPTMLEAQTPLAAALMAVAMEGR